MNCDAYATGPQLIPQSVLELRGPSEWFLTEATTRHFPLTSVRPGRGGDGVQAASAQAEGNSHIGLQLKARGCQQSLHLAHEAGVWVVPHSIH